MKRFNTTQQAPATKKARLNQLDPQQEGQDLQTYGSSFYKRQLSEAIARLSSRHKPDTLSEPPPHLWPVAVTAVLHQLDTNTNRTRRSYKPAEVNALRTIPWLVGHTTIPKHQLEAHSLLYSLATHELHQAILLNKTALEHAAQDKLRTLARAWLLQENRHHHLWLITTLLNTHLGQEISRWTILLQLTMYDRLANGINTAK